MNIWRGITIGLLIVFVFVIVIDATEKRKECEAKGGIYARPSLSWSMQCLKKF